MVWSLRETKIEPDLQLMLLFIVRGIVNELDGLTSGQRVETL